MANRTPSAKSSAEFAQSLLCASFVVWRDTSLALGDKKRLRNVEVVATPFTEMCRPWCTVGLLGYVLYIPGSSAALPCQLVYGRVPEKQRHQGAVDGRGRSAALYIRGLAIVLRLGMALTVITATMASTSAGRAAGSASLPWVYHVAGGESRQLNVWQSQVYRASAAVLLTILCLERGGSGCCGTSRKQKIMGLQKFSQRWRSSRAR